jgi:putative membrane protein
MAMEADMAVATLSGNSFLLDLPALPANVTATVGPPEPLIAHDRGDHMNMDWDGGGGWVMLIAMGVFWLSTLAVVAWAISLFARRDRHPEESPIEIARRRYARGEITAEELERIRRNLT